MMLRPTLLLLTFAVSYILHCGYARQGASRWCPPCHCGINGVSRVVGGKPNRMGDNPWMVALVTRGHIFFCGGTLIADVYVLTAAHCLTYRRPSDVDVVLSEKNHVDMDEDMAERRSVSQIILHHEYGKPTKWSNDIALLRLDYPVSIGTSAIPVCLPMPERCFTGQDGYIAGWGRTSEDGTSSSELLVAQVPILSREQCMKLQGYKNITKDMMCAGNLSGGVDTCQGDSGGPLLVTDKNSKTVIAGIVSWGIGCARPNKPGVYTRVSHYISWIKNKTRNACYCS